MVPWGLFERDGSFIPVEGTPDPGTLAHLFRDRVLRMLLDEGAIEGSVVRNFLARPRCSGAMTINVVIERRRSSDSSLSTSVFRQRPPMAQHASLA
jgi:hypothetical protein